MLYGYDAGVLGGVQNTQPFLNAMGNPTGSFVIPMIASSCKISFAQCIESLLTVPDILAATVMSVGVMFVGMPLGRRWCIMAGDILVIVGSAIQASSMSVPQIIVARCLCVRFDLFDLNNLNTSH